MGIQSIGTKLELLWSLNNTNGYFLKVHTQCEIRIHKYIYTHVYINRWKFSVDVESSVVQLYTLIFSKAIGEWLAILMPVLQFTRCKINHCFSNLSLISF